MKMKFCNAIIKAEVFTAQLYKTLKFFIAMPFLEDLKNHIKANTKGERSSDILQIMVNGPSMQKTFDKIKEGLFTCYDVCMVNHTANMDDFYRIKPKYFVMSDPAFYHPAKELAIKANKVYENINSRVEWDMNVYVQYTWYKDKEYKNRFTNSKLNVIPFHSMKYEGLELLRNPLMKHDLGSADYGTVLLHAIHIGILLGYKEIHLYGADHTFFDGLCVTDENVVCRRTAHVGDEKDAEIKPLFQYYNGVQMPYTMSFFLAEYAKWYKGHDMMKAFADYMGVKIINKTEGSMLDTYPRE